MKYKLIKPTNSNYSVIEQILTNRNIPLNLISKYLNTTDEVINSPLCFGEQLMRKSASTLIQHIQNNDNALIIVDSDCDGFTSSAILINYLYSLFPSYVENKIHYILHSGKQHGLNDHIEELLEDNQYKLIIIPDAGTNDTIACKKLYERSKDVIIMDQHLKEQDNPYAIIINNQIQDYPNKEFSGAGVTWQFCRYIDLILNTSYADNFLDLVALGLCADMMSMTSLETKHLINKGFKNVTNPFFYSLAQKNEYSMKGKINHTSVAFYIAPYVNAICRSGTIEEKTLVFESMLYHKAFKELPSTKRGHYLGETERLVDQAIRTAINVKSRQTKAQDAGMERLEEKINNEHLLNHKVILFRLEPGEIDKNIAGLCANKIMAKYQRPVMVLTRCENEIISTDKISNLSVRTHITYEGSARGCDKIDIDDFKELCAETGLTNYLIGHPNAFGASLDTNKIQTFLSLTDAALSDISNEAIYYVDYIYKGNNFLPEDLLTIANMEELWGKDVEEPYLCIEHLRVSADMVTVYQKKDNTLKITLPNGVSLMKFKASDEECYKLQNTNGWYELNIVGRANQNEWMGNISAQLFIEDYQIIDSCDYIF